MSIFSEIISQLEEIPKGLINNYKDELQKALKCLDAFEEKLFNRTNGTREAIQKGKINRLTTLQSINEDEDEVDKVPSQKNKASNQKPASAQDEVTTAAEKEDTGKSKRPSRKRSRQDVDGLSSPDQDKRQKRNASVKAQNIISKQINVNLNQKMRREDEVLGESKRTSRAKRGRKDNKENEHAIGIINIKQEKISLPPTEPMAIDVPIENIVKKEDSKDEIAMPPPVAPLPRPRRGAKEKVEENTDLDTSKRSTRNRQKSSMTAPGPRRGAKEKVEENTDLDTSKRSTRNRQKSSMTAPVAPATRSTRSSSRTNISSAQVDTEIAAVPITEPRPKRTRAKKKQRESTEREPVQEERVPQSDASPPPETSRPKRTRRGPQNYKEIEDPEDQGATKKTVINEPEQEKLVNPEPVSSPILRPNKAQATTKDVEPKANDEIYKHHELNETHIIETHNEQSTSDMNTTVVLPNRTYNHSTQSPKTNGMDEVLDLDTRSTMVIEKHCTMDETVIISKKLPSNMTNDDSFVLVNSLMSDDLSDVPQTPPTQETINAPTSVVKEKVQQFEELASRVTRTKTRAMVKKAEIDYLTPPDKIGTKSVLSADTLSKMSNLIFNEKKTQISKSAIKARSNTATAAKSFVTYSTSKASTYAKFKEAAEETIKNEKEDARKKKEALLEAKKEQQKKKREEKVAAAAAVREAAERDRKAAIEAAVKEKMEKQANADQGRLERQREVEKKKLEFARKAAETEERRRVEVQARQQRLAEEQRRMDNIRKKQQEEAEAMKKEAAVMARDMEKRQKEYIEKQMKQKLEANKSHTPMKAPSTPGSHYQLDPVYMQDGFQYLNSDEEYDDTPNKHPVPNWSVSKVRWQQLKIQSQIKPSHIDRLFSVRCHQPDLRQIFPNIDRRELKRTSSIVWRTPPSKLAALPE